MENEEMFDTHTHTHSTCLLPVVMVYLFHLRVDVQDADLAGLDHLVDGVDLGAVQVTVVFAVLQEAATLDVRLHLGASHEQVHLPLLLIHFGLTGRVCGAERENMKGASWETDRLVSVFHWQKKGCCVMRVRVCVLQGVVVP